MKALPKKLLPLTVFAIAVTSLFSVQPAQALTITLEQVGSNVVATGSGAFNLTGLFGQGLGAGFAPQINPTAPRMLIGPPGGNVVNIYTGLTGPTSFGSPAGTHFGAGGGDFFGIFSAPIGLELLVPALYGSGNALSANSTFFGSTFASLGVTPGTYVWTWGAGGANQNFTLQIGPAGVPDGGSTVSLLGCALLGLAVLRRKLNR